MTTVLSGLNHLKEINALASGLKTRLCCGGTVKDGSIELQGDHTQQLDIILRELGIVSIVMK